MLLSVVIHRCSLTPPYHPAAVPYCHHNMHHWEVPDRLFSAKKLNGIFLSTRSWKRCVSKFGLPVQAVKVVEQSQDSNQIVDLTSSDNGAAVNASSDYIMEQSRTLLDSQRKTKIVCIIGPSTSTCEMIWKLAEAGMNVAHLNMSHGDHASHRKTIDLVKKYNAQFKDKVVAIMLDTKGPEVRSGDVPQPIY
ncbi:hypothetical protein Ancab_015705 [Ancistrocladus abbreviatus]